MFKVSGFRDLDAVASAGHLPATSLSMYESTAQISPSLSLRMSPLQRGKNDDPPPPSRVGGRKRGLEYKEQGASGKAAHWDVEEWATPEQAREVLQTAADKKAAKARELTSNGIPYPRGTGLLIYLNIYDFGAHHDAIKSEFAASVQAATGWFPIIWILWKGVAYRVFG